jgi:GH15 family glucan-1,4-alpha-glucosidase
MTLSIILPNGEKDLTINSSVSTIFAYGVLDASDFRLKNTRESLERPLWVKTDVGGFSGIIASL